MVVLKRAMKGGKKAALAAKQKLISNNPDTQPLLEMLPVDGPLPTMQRVKQQASERLLDSLTKLAEQCSAAQCQPLEVFTRSVQCTTHKSARESLAVKGRIYQRQQRLHQLDRALARLERELPTGSSIMHHHVGLRQQGVPPYVASLTANFLQYYGMLRAHCNQPATEHRSDLDHLLPGRLCCSWKCVDERAFPYGLCHSHSAGTLRVVEQYCAVI